MLDSSRDSRSIEGIEGSMGTEGIEGSMGCLHWTLRNPSLLHIFWRLVQELRVDQWPPQMHIIISMPCKSHDPVLSFLSDVV